MRFIEIEDKIQFANVLESPVQGLYEHLYQIQYTKLALRRIDHKDKVKGRIIPVDNPQLFSRPRGMVQKRVKLWGIKEVA